MAIVLAVSAGRIDLTVFPFVVPDFPAVFVVVAATGIDVQPAGASTRTTDGEAHFAASITPGTFPVMDTVDVVAIGPQKPISRIASTWLWSRRIGSTGRSTWMYRDGGL